MSHQTGIQANEELRSFFGKCRDGLTRLIKIDIVKEQLSLGEYAEPKSDSWIKDYEPMILPLIQNNQPCFILFRLDTFKNNSYEWLLFTWSPESSPVRQKMLYASTKATLKKEFGAAQIKEEVFATSREEASWKGYEKIKRNRDAPAPLTPAEQEMQELKQNELNSDIGVGTKFQTLQGVLFPLTTKALDALTRFCKKQHNYVQLKIDIEKEVIDLASTTDTPIQSLCKRVPETTARYHVFNFPHTHEGDYLESHIFIYSMPGSTCSIKERMLYSSCKGPLISALEQQLGLFMDKKIEIDTGDELTEEFLLEELHPTKSLSRPQFAKPKGPANRGLRRIVKHAENENTD